MGGCTSKPKTTEYEGLMDPHAKGSDFLGRNSMDADNESADVARQSEDSGLKAIGRSNSAQKGSERSLQNLFVKVGQQQDRGDENLEANNDTTLRDVLRSIGDPKKQTIAGLNPETNLVKAEERKSDLKEKEKFLCSGEEATVTKSPGKVEEATDSGLKNAQEKPASAGPFQDPSADDSSALSPKQAKDVDDECAAVAETEPQEKNGPVGSVRRDVLQESVVCSEMQLVSQEHSIPSEESAEQPKAPDLGVEVVKRVDSGRTEEESSGSDTIASSQASEVAQPIVLTDAPADSDGSLEMKADAFDERKAAAPEGIPHEGVSKAPDSKELEQAEEKLGWKSSERACIVEGSDLAHKYATSRAVDVSTCSMKSPVDVAIEDVSHAEVGTEAFGICGPSTGSGAAATETHDQSCPTKELEGQDHSSVVPSDFAALTEPSKTEAADNRRDAEDYCDESLPGVEGSLSADSSSVAGAESSVQDEAMNQMSVVDDSRLASNENPGGSPILQAGTPSASVEGVVFDINACELSRPRSPENCSDENSRSLRETELNPKGVSMEGNGLESPPQVKSDNVVTETDSTDWEPAPSQESMYPEQDWRAGSPELGEGEASTRQEVIGEEEENICTSQKTEFNPKGSSVEDNGLELPLLVDSNVVVTEMDSTGWDPAPSQESMDPEQDGRASSSPELGESDSSARQEVIGKGDMQEMQQSVVPSTQEDSNLCDHLPSTADQVVEVPQGSQMDSSQLMRLEEQHQVMMSQPRECLEVTAQKALSPQMKLGEVTENEVLKKLIPNEEVPTKEAASSDIDQVLEKLASEFERQASAEMGGEFHRECSAISTPSK